MKDLDDVAAVECRAAREHLEQHGADREQIAAGVDGLAGDLLGRHVARRAHQHPCPRQVCGRVERSRQLRVARPRQAEIEQLHAVGREEHVGRLEVAVDDALGMQRRERGQHPEADGHGIGHAQRPAPQALGQRLTLEQLHGDEQLAALLADLIELADVRVVDPRGGPGFAPETLACRLVAGQRRHRLQRDGALQPLVARRVDDTHPACPQLAGDRVVPYASGQALGRRSARDPRRGMGRQRGARHPVVESAQPSAGRVVDRLLRHGNADHTPSRRDDDACSMYAKYG